MKQVLASLIIVFVFLSGSINLTAQYNTAGFYTKSYKAEDGLPDSYVLKIYEDSHHYLWIGTYSGLSRFDGRSFTNYGVNNRLPDLYVGSIIEDHNNRLWVGTRKTIGYLSNNTYVITPFEDNAEIDYIFNFAYVLNDKLWAFTSKGLYELDGLKWGKKITVKGFENEPCRYAAEKDGSIYYCYATNIIKVLPGGVSKVIASDTSDDPFFILFRKFNNRLFVTTPLGLFEIVNDKLVALFARQLTGKKIYNFFYDKQKRFWVSTKEDGLLVSEPGNENELANKIELSSSLISNLYEDSQGNMWVADYQGLVKTRSSFFDDFKSFQNKTSGQYYNLSKDEEGTVYLYHFKNGFYYFDGHSFKENNISPGSSVLKDRTGKNLIDVIAHDEKNNLWAVSRQGGLIKMSGRGNQEFIYPSGKKDTSSEVSYLTYNPVNRILYICGRKLFLDDENEISEFKSKQNNSPIRNTVKALVLKNGNVLVNSSASGLWLVKPNHESFELSKKMNFPIDGRTLFTEDRNGSIWISFAGAGLQRFSWANDSTLIKETSVTTMNGLPNDVVEAMTVDGKNRLWAATLSGLLVLDTLPGSAAKKFIMYNVGRETGLNFTINTGLTKLMADDNGDIWFCSDELVTRFHSKQLNIVSPPPLTHIESIRLQMKETDWHQWSDSLEGYFMLPQNLELPFNQNTLTFTFKGINYNSEEDVWYSYKLMGVDTAWGPTTANNVISFIKLTQGHFTFMVRARNNNSSWSEPTVFSFTIKAPFWKTWWFRGIGILVASLILVFIFRTQLKRIHKRASLQDQLRNLEMKALKAQMNPHFIYNALNSIQSLVIDDKKTDALDYMVKFSRLLRQALNHSELNTVSLDKELDALKLYIQLESLRLNYSLNYSIKLDDNIIPEKEKIPPMILQPFVENALWHGLSRKEGNKVLYIYVRGEENNLRFDISDNGIGRARAAEMKKPDSYYEGPRGIAITQSRLTLYNIDASFKPIEVHDIVNADNSAGGTIVTVRIKR